MTPTAWLAAGVFLFAPAAPKRSGMVAKRDGVSIRDNGNGNRAVPGAPRRQNRSETATRTAVTSNLHPEFDACVSYDGGPKT
jgi:hypothetical protein